MEIVYHEYMKFLYRWGPVFLWMAVIFFFSTRERITVSTQYTVNFVFFKTLHLIEYAFLYLLTYRAMKQSFPHFPPSHWALWSFIIVILYATTDEYHQLFVPTREGTVRDVIIDGLAATLSWIAITKLLPKVPKKLQKQARKLLGI